LPGWRHAAGGEHGVVAGLAEHFVQLAAPHALVAPVVEREHHRVASRISRSGGARSRVKLAIPTTRMQSWIAAPAVSEQYTLVMIASSWAKPWVCSKS
jgi:hypothetical protein